MTFQKKGLTMAKRIPAVLVLLALTACLAWQPAAMAQSSRNKGGYRTRFKEAMADPKVADELARSARKGGCGVRQLPRRRRQQHKPSVPNLAGQNPAYLLEQVRQFRRRTPPLRVHGRHDPSDEQRRENRHGAVLHSAQDVVHKPTADKGPGGPKAKTSSAKTASRCHGDIARQRPDRHIAGQQTEYLRPPQALPWPQHPRQTDLATPNTKLLSDNDIEALGGLRVLHALTSEPWWPGASQPGHRGRVSVYAPRHSG